MGDFNEEAEEGNTIIEATAAKIRETEIEDFSWGKQFKYLETSGTLDALQEDMTKLVEENGKLSAKNVKDLAESSADLATFLELD
jgi:hypothetical protein